MNAFQQLTRGLKFDCKRFNDEAQKFGLSSGRHTTQKTRFETVVPTLDDVPVSQVPPPSVSREGTDQEDSQEDSDTDSSHEDLTLLGDIKVKKKVPKKSKAKAKRTHAKALQMHKEKVNHFRNAHRIHVQGTDIPDPVDHWERLKARYDIPDNLLSVIQQHYPKPTAIQMQSIPCMLERRELMVCAPTGSGKTAAYLIPLLHLLREPQKKGVRAVILSPTRELAQQIHREAVKLGECRGIRSLVLDPTLNKASKKFSEETARKYDLIVSTPNRLVYLLKEEKINMSTVEWLIVDESDKLFESGPKGFRDQLAVIYRSCDVANIRRGMFSATLAVDVEQWCKLNLDNVLSVTIGARNSATETIEQKLVYTGTEKGKVMAMKNLITEGMKPPVLIFVQAKDRAKELHKELSNKACYGDLHVDVIHSDRSELQRDATVKSFRSGRVWVLICTELMGRGIDFKGVNLVINYDFPPSVFSYIHRIGRTGRAGRAGKAITLFTDQDKVLLRSIAQVVKSSGGEVPEYMMTLKKASRQEKRKLSKKAVEREGIIPESKYDKEKRAKKEAMVEGSKRRKRKRDEAAANSDGGGKSEKKDDLQTPAKKQKKAIRGGSSKKKKDKLEN